MAEPQAPRVQPLFAPAQPPPAAPEPGVGVLEVILGIASARSLALIALCVAGGVWGYAAYDPTLYRLWAGVGVSLGVLVPCLWLSWKKG